MNKIYIIITFILLLPGIIGIIIPVLPGIPYMFAISFIYGLLTRFISLNAIELIILALLAILSLIVDYSSGIMGAKYGGATKKSLIYGLAGLIVGTIIFPPFGGIIGLFIAIFISEILVHNNNKKAAKAASYSVLGSLTGMIINLVLAIIFLICFLAFTLN